MELKYDPRALIDLEDAEEWYEVQRPGLAVRFDEIYKNAVSQILARPFAWPKVNLGARRYLLNQFPYAIFYLANETCVTIVAVAHTSRRPGHWRSRLKH